MQLTLAWDDMFRGQLTGMMATHFYKWYGRFSMSVWAALARVTYGESNRVPTFAVTLVARFRSWVR